MEPLNIRRGEKVLLRYQLTENGSPVNIRGKNFSFRVKTKGPAKVPLKAGFRPVEGVIEDEKKGRFFFTVLDTEDPLKGIYEVFMRSGDGAEITLTPPGGIGIEIV